MSSLAIAIVKQLPGLRLAALDETKAAARRASQSLPARGIEQPDAVGIGNQRNRFAEPRCRARRYANLNALGPGAESERTVGNRRRPSIHQAASPGRRISQDYGHVGFGLDGLDEIDRAIQATGCRMSKRPPCDVLRPYADQHAAVLGFAAGVRIGIFDAPILTVDPSLDKTPSRKFIAGLPMKLATKTFFGASYNACGVSYC